MSETVRDEAYQWTPALEPGDGRLKILWIEDKPETLVPRYVGKWFSIIVVTTPGQLTELISRSRSTSSTRERLSGQVYDIAGLPADACLTDLRMCDRLQDGCTDKGHLAVGLHAPSAGFLMGVLTAFHWPRYPQVLVPYSGYDEEFGQIWALTLGYFPPGLSIQTRYSKGNRSSEVLLQKTAEEVRLSLEKASRVGTVHVTWLERNRLKQLLAQSSWIDAAEKVWLSGPGGVRPYSVGSLFYGQIEPQHDGVLASSVSEWLESLDSSTPEEHAARRLALAYWSIRCSSLSEFLYSHVGRIAESLESLPVLPKLEPLTHYAKGGPESRVVVRLALYFLIIVDHLRMGRPRQGIDQEVVSVLRDLQRENLTSSELVERIAEIITEARSTSDPLAERLSSFMKWIQSPTFMVRDDSWNAVIAQTLRNASLPSSEGTLIRAICPIPISYADEQTLSKEEKVGKAAMRLCQWFTATDDSIKALSTSSAVSALPESQRNAVLAVAEALRGDTFHYEHPFVERIKLLALAHQLELTDKIKGAFISSLGDKFSVKDMIAGDWKHVTDVERRACQRFARERAPNEADWPPALVD